MRYHQLTLADRYTLGILRRQELSVAEIAEAMGRHRSTIWREIKRGSSKYDDAYRPTIAQEKANNRRLDSRRMKQFGPTEWDLVEGLLRQNYSPEQVAGRLRREGLLNISHETIYLHVWRDKKRQGNLWQHLRQPTKRRKRYGSYEKRGRVGGKRHISERPVVVDLRQEVGHWEMDTVLGTGDQHCILTLTERLTGNVLIGKLRRRTVEEATRCAIGLIGANPGLFHTITSDNGTEFHGYRDIERATGVEIFFATPYHSWERGTNENTNGLIRQYLPKRTSMKHVTQAHCNEIAMALNTRPRKRHGFQSPLERLDELLSRHRDSVTR